MQNEHRVATGQRFGPWDAPALLIAPAIPNDDRAAVSRSLELVM